MWFLRGLSPFVVDLLCKMATVPLASPVRFTFHLYTREM